MASPAEVLNNVKNGWQKLDINQKMIIAITVIVFLVALGSLGYWISRPSYSILFTNLSPEDASSITAKLQEMNVPYKLVGMQTIEVPTDKVYDTRINLAGAGLPQGGTIGFEIFDNTSFGLSQFTQKVNYRRALEGELVRTISEMSEVNGARVHIVMPEPSLYSEKENPATASIVIKPRAGARLAENQVQGIVNLVARSVEGLKAENITVVDTNGNVLNESGGSSGIAGGNYTKSQLDAKEAYESNIERAIGSMLTTVLGSENNAVVRVSADLDFSQTEIKRNLVSQSENPVVVSEQTDSEKYDGDSSSLPSGVAGVSSQNQGSTTGYTQSATQEGNGSYSRKNSTRNYEYDKISEHEVKLPGQVKKLSVAVIVNNDGSKPINAEKIENAVAAAAGIDKTRGDVLTVSSMAFDTEWMKKEEQAIAEAEKRETYATYGKYALVAILFLVGLFALFRIIASIKPAKPKQEFISRPAAGLKAVPNDLGDLGEITASNLSPERRREMAIKQRKLELAREEIQSLARERPGDVAQLLRLWLNT